MLKTEINIFFDQADFIWLIRRFLYVYKLFYIAVTKLKPVDTIKKYI